MEVVVRIDDCQQNPDQEKKKKRKKNVGSSSESQSQSQSEEESISILCSRENEEGIAKTRSRSYSFATDALQPLEEEEEEEEDGDISEHERNRSFDFGVDVGGEISAESKILVATLPSSSPSKYCLLPQEDEANDQTTSRSLPPTPCAHAPKQVTLDERLSRSFVNKPPKKSSIQLPQGKKDLRSALALDSSSSDDDDDDDDDHENGTTKNKSPEKRNATATLKATIQATAAYNRLKSKSRLADAPAPPTIVAADPAVTIANPSPKRSPTITTQAQAEEEEDPLIDADLPEKYRKHRWGFCSLFQFTALVLLIAFLACSVRIDVLSKHSVWGLELWKWDMMVLVVLSGRLLSGWFIRIIVFFVERNFLLRKRVLYFVYGLHRGVQTIVWLALALLAWSLLFDPKVERSTKNHKALTYITKLLVCFLLASFIWLGKLLFVKVLASSYHVSTYFDRIQESLFNQYILETLSGPPMLRLAQPQQKDKDKDKEKNKKLGKEGDAISIQHLQKMNQMNVSAWNMKRLITLVKQSGISTLAQSIEYDSVDYDEEADKETEIQSEWQAKAAAKKIFKNVAKPGRRHIVYEDLLRFLEEEEAKKALALFEGAAEGTITKKGLVNWVTNVYRERRSLALSLNDTKTAVNKLHQIINAIVCIIIVIIWLLVLGLATSHLLVVVSSQLLLIVFVFGNTCKTVFEAIIFLFVMHPYDVGDRCVIDGVQMVVEEMNILTTVFLRYDNEKIYYPNSLLANKPISNFYRSPDMGDAFDFSVSMSTTVDKIVALKDKISRYVESHSHHWHPKHSVVVKDIEDMNKMKMALYVQHTMNYQNAGEKGLRRSELLINLKTYFEELEIEYHLLPQDISIKAFPH